MKECRQFVGRPQKFVSQTGDAADKSRDPNAKWVPHFSLPLREGGSFFPVPLRRRGLELLPPLFQEFLHFDGGHAASPCGGNGLTITPILYVAARVNSMHPREHIVVSLKISVGIGVELAGKHLAVGF